MLKGPHELLEKKPVPRVHVFTNSLGNFGLMPGANLQQTGKLVPAGIMRMPAGTTAVLVDGLEGKQEPGLSRFRTCSTESCPTSS